VLRSLGKPLRPREYLARRIRIVAKESRPASLPRPRVDAVTNADRITNKVLAVRASHLSCHIGRCTVASPSIQMLTGGEAKELAASAASAWDQAESPVDVAHYLTHWIARTEATRAALRAISLSLFTLKCEVEKGIAPVST